MAEPPVTITTSREGATAACHLCPWTAHTGHSPVYGVRSASTRISASWADHFAAEHTTYSGSSSSSGGGAR